MISGHFLGEDQSRQLTLGEEMKEHNREHKHNSEGENDDGIADEV